MSFSNIPSIYKQTYWYNGCMGENRSPHLYQFVSNPTIIHNRLRLYKLMTSLGTPKFVEKGSGRMPREVRSKFEGDIFDHVEVYRITHTTNCKCMYILITSPYGGEAHDRRAELLAMGYIKIQPIYNTSATSFMMVISVRTCELPTVMSLHQLSNLDTWNAVQNG